jgi:hypothetical protein
MLLGERESLFLLGCRWFGHALQDDLGEFIQQGELCLLDRHDSSQCLLDARGFGALLLVIGGNLVTMELSLDGRADESGRGGVATPSRFLGDLFREAVRVIGSFVEA